MSYFCFILHHIDLYTFCHSMSLVLFSDLPLLSLQGSGFNTLSTPDTKAADHRADIKSALLTTKRPFSSQFCFSDEEIWNGFYVIYKVMISCCSDIGHKQQNASWQIQIKDLQKTKLNYLHTSKNTFHILSCFRWNWSVFRVSRCAWFLLFCHRCKTSPETISNWHD